jgi:polyribonucleotide nucleotidyltransferase
VPRIVSFKVPTDKIGAIIGTGGKVIREIIDKTGTQIDIEDDGLVKIYGQPGEKLDQAVGWVKVLGGQIEKGARYNGRITRIAEFGLFVELVPGKDGLVHISAIPRSSQDAFMKSMKMNDRIMVEVVDYDKETDRIRLKPLETPA